MDRTLIESKQENTTTNTNNTSKQHSIVSKHAIRGIPPAENTIQKKINTPKNAGEEEKKVREEKQQQHIPPLTPKIR